MSAAILSNTIDNADPFHSPIGQARRDFRIAAGLVVGLPAPSYPPGTGSDFSCRLSTSNFPFENWLIAISNRKCPFFLGTAMTKGLFPNLTSAEPHGGITGMPL